MSSSTDSMLVFVPVGDIACFLAASMFRCVHAKRTYRIFDPKDRRTWPNPNIITSSTWLYILGSNFPEMPVHEAKAKKVFRIVATESLSVAGVFWTTMFGLPLAFNPVLLAFERVWSNAPNVISGEWGLRFALMEYAQMAVKEGVEKALIESDAYFSRSTAAILADCDKHYESKMASMLSVIKERPQYTVHVSEEVVKEFGLPKEWLGFVVRFVDTTGVEVDTSFLAYNIRTTLPGVDILVQYRRHQLKNNACHRYYCRTISDKVTTLLDWSILAGHPRAASGQVTGATAPFSDATKMEAIDDMPPLVEA
jgi:hypothetical protein